MRPHPASRANPGRTLLLAALAALAAVPAPATTRPAKTPAGAAKEPWLYPVLEKATTAANYARAAAHEPLFDDKALWPMLEGKERYVRQQWPKGRLLVWAHPGKSGFFHPRREGLDPTDPRNWLEDGKPCGKLVLDENADLLFPPSETPYKVGFRNSRVREVCRHLTIEPGAQFIGGGDGVGRNVHGNVWIKKGGQMYSQGATRLLGGRDTFFRNDNVRETTVDSRGRVQRQKVSQYFQFNKPKASVEFLGYIAVLDEFRVYGCTVIVGPGSKLMPGRAAAPTIYQGGHLALLDGAVFESWNNDFGNPEMTLEDGTIQGGLPERPLRQSCTFGLAFKNYTKAVHKDLSDKDRGRNFVRVPSLVVRKGALRSYTPDAARARLVFRTMDGEDLAPRPGTKPYEDTIAKRPEQKALIAWKLALPRGLDCFLAKGVVVDGVEFDGFRKGGILLQNPADRARWRNVFFGPNNQAPAPQLVAPLPGLDRNGRY